QLTAQLANCGHADVEDAVLLQDLLTDTFGALVDAPGDIRGDRPAGSYALGDELCIGHHLRGNAGAVRSRSVHGVHCAVARSCVKAAHGRERHAASHTLRRSRFSSLSRIAWRRNPAVSSYSVNTRSRYASLSSRPRRRIIAAAVANTC